MLSNHIFTDMKMLPDKWIYVNQWVVGSNIKVENLQLAKIDFGMNDELPIDIQTVALMKNKLIRILEDQHPDSARLFEEPWKPQHKFNILVTNLLDYESYKINWCVQVAVNCLLEARSPDFYFNIVTTEYRKRHWFRTLTHMLEYKRNYDY
jgi:hypothetical protein